MEFEWDPNKATSNFAKHNISFHEASTVFSDPLSLTFSDPDRLRDEARYITIGESVQGQLLIISHTDREQRIRIISARKVTHRERRIYESD
jgi:uncharacterized DUF497 family protein